MNTRSTREEDCNLVDDSEREMFINSLIAGLITVLIYLFLQCMTS